MADFQENVIEWITGQDRVTLSLSQRRHINKVKALAVQIAAQNSDGSICAHIPIEYLRFIRPRELSEEEKQRRASFLPADRTKSGENTEPNASGE